MPVAYTYVKYVALLALTACASPAEDQAPPVADSMRVVDTRLAQVTSLATDTLATIESDNDWIQAATEIALALELAGRPRDAVDMLDRAATRAAALEDNVVRASAEALIIAALLDLGSDAAAAGNIANATRAAEAIDDDGKRWDALGKLAVLNARAGNIDAALTFAIGMPESDDNLASYKARTLHDIAPLQARENDIDAAVSTLSLMTMGLPYYRAAAASDVAIAADAAGRSADAEALLEEAAAIARGQTDGYFVAGALRHVAVAYSEIGDAPRASGFFAEALDASLSGASPQHRARAVSRAATSLADVGELEAAKSALPNAVDIARSETREPFQLWAFYEIAGSAAFAGDFEMAMELMEAVPPSFRFGANSLRAATERDVAWGLARHGRVDEAMALAVGIESPRESVQALSRIARVIDDPEMIALPRYL